MEGLSTVRKRQGDARIAFPSSVRANQTENFNFCLEATPSGTRCHVAFTPLVSLPFKFHSFPTSVRHALANHSSNFSKRAFFEAVRRFRRSSSRYDRSC